jgi:hypothetical protein
MGEVPATIPYLVPRVKEPDRIREYIMSFRWLAVLMTAAAMLGGCSDHGNGHNDGADAAPVNCEVETRDDEYVAGLEKIGASGLAVVLVESTPAPPAKNDNTWRLRVLDSAGTPLGGLTVEVTPFMPDHGHGTPINAEVTALAEPGEYQAAPINLWMPGLWEVRVAVESPDVSDSVVFRFCIEG